MFHKPVQALGEAFNVTSQGFGVEVQIPFDCVTIAMYLLHCFQQSNSSASLTLVYRGILQLSGSTPLFQSIILLIMIFAVIS